MDGAQAEYVRIPYAEANLTVLPEGLSSEAASIAGTLGLGKLVYFYDDNHITIDGTTSISFTEDRAKRFEALGWHVQFVADPNDLAALRKAIKNAQGETVKRYLPLASQQTKRALSGLPTGPRTTRVLTERPAGVLIVITAAAVGDPGRGSLTEKRRAIVWPRTTLAAQRARGCGGRVSILTVTACALSTLPAASVERTRICCAPSLE